jgi:hypothetical protein
VEHVPLDEIAADPTYRLREPGDVAELAAAIGRLGQLTPVDLRPLPAGADAGEGKRWQVVAGFRRLEALRLLQRERVLARVHPSLSDDDAWALALAAPLFSEPWSPADLDGVAARVGERLPWATPALEAIRGRAGSGKARAAPAPSPESATTSAPASTTPRPRPAADPAGFARGLAVRAFELNGDVAAAYEAWGALPPEGRRLVLEQLRWLHQVFPLLEKENR